MPSHHDHLLIVIDDRELAAGDVRGVVGPRRYGDILFQRRTLFERCRASLPAWARQRLVHLRSHEQLAELRAALEASGDDAALCVIAGRAGFPDTGQLFQLIERLPYAEDSFSDRLYQPLLVFLRNAHWLVQRWPAFEAAPLHSWEPPWQELQRLQSLQPLDLAQLQQFLTLTSGSTATRHFNQVHVDDYYYTKSSTDQRKMRAEYSFYALAPEAMRPWLIQPFDYREHDGRASYKMMRYYLADAALQWVHGAFETDTFQSFIERLLFFVAQRPRRACSREQAQAEARKLFVDKVQQRAEAFLAQTEGRRIDTLVAASAPSLALGAQLQRYLRLYGRHETSFALDYQVVGHGDPCFSNILYDQQRHLMKLIDPKGAVDEAELWTHPLYDLCKISHSVLGDYDFINNGLYRVGFADDNTLQLQLSLDRQAGLKPLFARQLARLGHDPRVVRLGEASLFLSMLPLHIDYPNKVMAFLLKANAILDEVEFGQAT
ncbi:hypothetical protein FHW58_002896 [Duganella sp. 1224]|uniref:hypothetical protein n=1 Tax=Duganella sp. 1224 TaxID=2587052 RepID=UPI0015CE20B4|nr:hypothetical protein [Duganella sp. 1224]NYE61689.1 hypothetical protein [Duganella sp. 1224]